MAASSVGLPDVNIFKNETTSRLADLLNSIEGEKDLILDPDLIVPLERIAGAQFLKRYRVDKIFKLEPQSSSTFIGSRQRIYFICPEIPKTKIIADHINADKAKEKRHFVGKIEVVMVPRKLYYCEEVLEYEGVFGNVNIKSFDLGLIPLEKDILSLEIPKYFTDIFLNKDYTWIHTVANSLVNIQSAYGRIPNVYVQGNSANLVYELMHDILRDNKEIKTVPQDIKIGQLFLIDRDVDFASSLLTQLTYEGHIDEVFSIKCGYVVFGPEVTRKNESTKLSLSSDDKVFDEIRDCHVGKVSHILLRKIKELTLSAEKRQNMNVKEIYQFVSKELQDERQKFSLVGLHLGACDAMYKKQSQDGIQEQLRIEHNIIEGVSYQECVNFIEDAIIHKIPIEQALRLMCLLSCAQDGLPSKDYNLLRVNFLQAYGHEHLITFFNLSKMKLFYEQKIKLAPPTPGNFLVERMASAISYLGGKSTFHTLIRKLNLSPQLTDESNPTDLGYVFGGTYIPLITNFVQMVLDKEGFEGMEEIIKLLPGPTVADVQVKSARGKGKWRSPSERVVVVCFLGGVTYAEIAAFRLLGRLRGYRFIIVATSIINGKFLMNSAIPVV